MNKNGRGSNAIIISLVITTYKRAYHLIKILNCLKKNYFNFKRFEIIICNSSGKDISEVKVKAFQSNHNYLKITYLNINQNLNSVKRNRGFAEAVGKYVIFIDDDCYPDYDFLKNYFHVFSKTNTKKRIFCGSVKYPTILMKNSFIRYRQSRHFFFKDKLHVSSNKIGPEKIVTMNMAMAKHNFPFNNKLFNEKFNVYGFEDFEFGYRVIKKKFQIIPCSPIVYHYDDRSFSIFLNKIKFLGNESMKYLIKINLDAAKKNNFYKLENNFMIKNLLKLKFLNFFLKKIIAIFIFMEKLKILPFFLYKLAFALSYLSGCFYRRSLNKDFVLKNWYK